MISFVTSLVVVATLAASADAPADHVPPAPASVLSTSSSAEEREEAERALHFADHLFKDGDWYRAITEYRRYLFLTRGVGSEAPRAAMAIGEALLRGEQNDAAGRQLDGVATRTLDLRLRQQSLFGAGLAYLQDGRPELAKPRFRLLVQDPTTQAELQTQSRWMLAWGHFDAGELDQAGAYFRTIASSSGPHAQDAAAVVDALAARDRLELKDPLVAALWSIIPGAGHMYLGQWGTGLTSLSWNALFLAATIAAFVQGDWAIGSVLAMFEIGWYSGSMYGAIAGAFKHNRDVVRNWRDDVLARYGHDRELPGMERVLDAPPGTIVRFSGSF